MELRDVNLLDIHRFEHSTPHDQFALLRREAPVYFDPRAAASVLSHVATALGGTALLRKASFMLDRLGTRVASPEVTIVDDARLPGGLASRPFDSEGIPSRTTTVIEEGILKSYLLDAYSAQKLGMRSTGNSTRELSGGPATGSSNFPTSSASRSAIRMASWAAPRSR